MIATQRYDAIVIGSGQGGNPLAKALAAAGRKTAVIEREHAGGTCINVGCTPTKTMVASARVAYLARRAVDFGVRTGPVSVDQAKVRERKRDIVARFRSGSERSLAKAKVELLMGEASFTGPKLLQVQMNSGERRMLTADLVFINTGARPARPEIPGLDRVTSLDSTSVMELDQVPEHLIIMGGGYIGLEFGQMFRRFGSAVTIIQRGRQLLTQEDPDVAEAVLAVLREDGVEVLLESEVRTVAPGSDGKIAVSVGDRRGPAPRAITGSHLLVAVGRRVPNSDRLNLAAAGVETDEKGFIRVNERLETTAPGVFALGDVKPGPAFTHISYDDFRILETNLLKGGHATTTGRLVPYAVFIDPELGRVGASEQEARRQGREVRVAKMPMSSVARATEAAETRGLMKVVIDAATDQILGCAILGIAGGELMSMVEIAMMGHLPYTGLQNAIFAHPTLAESLNNLFDYIEPSIA